MRSMTGFGAGAAPLASGRIHLEIRALNHKHTDVRLRLPQDLLDQSSFFEQEVRASVGRGRYDLNVRIEGEVGGTLQIDEIKLRSVYASLKRVRDEVAPDAELSLSALAALPEVLTSHGPEPHAVREALGQALKEALVGLDEMRANEGLALLSDLMGRLGRVRELRAQLEAGSADLVAHYRQKLTERIAQLLDATSAGLSPERLDHEVALLADKSDITEELVRLDSHFEQFGTLLKSSEPVGRRLDFLLQEISREVNTVGSKSQHAKVAHLVVEMKSEVERLREQVQNVD